MGVEGERGGNREKQLLGLGSSGLERTGASFCVPSLGLCSSSSKPEAGVQTPGFLLEGSPRADIPQKMP